MIIIVPISMAGLYHRALKTSLWLNGAREEITPMLETLAVVTFLLTNGTRSVLPVYPPGGEYHRHFGWICEQNKQNATEQVHKLLSEKKITPPDGVEQILSIKIFCVATTKA